METSNPRPPLLSLLLFTVVFLLSFSEVRPSPEDRRYTRGTTYQGIAAGIHRKVNLEAGDDLHINSVSTASITTSQTPAVAQVLSIQVPPEAVYVHDHGENVISSYHSESVVGHTSSVVISPPPEPFIRPEGELPIPPDRFGFDVPNGRHPGAMPNCGCVSRGACRGKVWAYTQLVLPYTDVVCGHKFQTCCFDGPYAGEYDSFAHAAACVAKEECARPYGVLPTDVRDFGAIAPCPGQGAVRCISVSHEELFAFQVAVAAIDAANSHHQHHIHGHQPIHLMIPVVTGTGGTEGTTTIEATATSSISGFNEDGEGHDIMIPPHHPTPSVVVQSPEPAQPNILVQQPSLAPPNIIFHAAAPAPDINIHQPPPPPQNIIVHTAAPAQPNIIVHQAPALPDVTIHVPPLEQPQVIQGETPAPVAVVVTPETPVVPVVAPPPAVVIPPAAIPGYYNPYYGAGIPWGGYGIFGKGFGIRKRISISKGFNKGFILG